LNQLDVIQLCKPPIGIEGNDVEFRLIYKGSLPAQASGGGGGRIPEKHSIRKQLHRQLNVLWKENLVLSFWRDRNIEGEKGTRHSVVDNMVRKYARFGFNFVPLVTEELGIACSLDILFLRRDAPGKIVGGGGDLDNRIKVLFDALRMPRYANEVEAFSPDADEDPFFVLLEDDTLINEVRINTDRLLTPIESGEGENDVVLIIHVKTIVVDSQKAYIEFYT
jgi:hypothetical protein